MTGMSLDDALSIVSEGRAYTVEHFGFTKDKFVGHFDAETYERATDKLVQGAAQMRGLLECLVDDDECWFDHHGGCQAHGFLSLRPDEICPHAEAKQILGRGGR